VIVQNYYPPSIGRFRISCGGGGRIRGRVGIRPSGSLLTSMRGVIIQHNTCMRKQTIVIFHNQVAYIRNVVIVLHSPNDIA